MKDDAPAEGSPRKVGHKHRRHASPPNVDPNPDNIVAPPQPSPPPGPARRAFDIQFWMADLPNRFLDPTQVSVPGTSKYASSVPISVSHFLAQEVSGTSHRTGVALHEDMLQHIPPSNSEYDECERPERLSVIVKHLREIGLLDRCVSYTFGEVTRDEIRLVHDAGYLSWVESIPFHVSIGVTSGINNYISKGSLRAARLAAGCTCEAALLVASGRLQNAFALVRPPGHHCGPSQADGFCLLNNIAIAARVAQKRCPDRVKRVMIIDFDVHHGNGTEAIFYDDPSVLVFNVQQYGDLPTHSVSAGLKREIARANHVTLNHAHAELKPQVSAGLEVASENRPATKDELEALLGFDDAPAVDDTALHFTDPKSEELKPPQSADSEVQPAKPKLPTNEEALEYFRGLYNIEEEESAEDASQELNEEEEEQDGEETPSDESSFDNAAPRQFIHYAFYPGTANPQKIGEGRAVGTNVNVSWPTTGFGDLEYLYVLEQLAVPLGKEFGPDLVLISGGFDSVDGDSLGSMKVSPSGYYAMTMLIRQLICPKVVVTLEGGYNLRRLPLCVEAVLRALLAGSTEGAETSKTSQLLLHQCERLIADVKKRLAPHWKCFRPKDKDDLEQSTLLP